jgi:hypothetical protein
MTNWSLYSTNAGLALNADAGVPFQAGITFEVTSGQCYYVAHRWFVPAGGDTAPQKFALWALTSSTTGVVVPGTVVTSGTLTAGQWNLIYLPAPVHLSPGIPYRACTGWQTVVGFPVNNNQFGSGDPFAAGITSGPVFAYSDSSGSASDPYGSAQGTFSSTAGHTDPSIYLPAAESNTANFGMDVYISDTVPNGLTGPFSIWDGANPNGNSSAVADLAANYNVGTVEVISASVTCPYIRYLSPSGCTDLATEASIWQLTGSLAWSKIHAIAAPSWSGAAGSGWLTAAFSSAPLLSPGTYAVCVYDGNVTPAAFNAKDSVTSYWTTGVGKSGLTNGPITMPSAANSPLAYTYFPADGGNTPPFTNVTTQLGGQSPFGQLPTAAQGSGQPYLYANPPNQNYFVEGIFYLAGGGPAIHAGKGIVIAG